GPMSFPQRHPLNGPGASTAYDFTVGLEAEGAQVSIIGPGLSTLLSRDPGNIGFGGIAPTPGRGGAARGRALEADAEASLPPIIEEVRRQMTPERQRLVQERSAKHAAANQQARIEAL